MFFVWSQKRINVKVAWWGPRRSGKTTTLYALAAEMRERAEATDVAERPSRQRLGMARNAEPVEVDEPDTCFTTYFGHPPGDIGQFGGYPVHYQCKTAEPPIEQNRAFETVLDGISAVVLTADAARSRQADNDAALRDLVERLARRHDLAAGGLAAHIEALFGDDGPLRLVLQVNKSDRDDAVDAHDVRRGLMLPERVPTIETAAEKREGVWDVFEACAEAMRPLLEAARRRGRIPETD